jgi:hypothetical protein
MKPTSITALHTFFFMANIDFVVQPLGRGPLFVPVVGIVASNNEQQEGKVQRQFGEVCSLWDIPQR